MRRPVLPAFCVPVLSLSHLMAASWLSYGNDPQCTSWSRKEVELNRQTAQSITLVWKTHLDNQPRELNSLTAAVAVEGVPTNQRMEEIVVVGGASDTIFAMNAETGKLLWKKTFAVEGKSRQEPSWLCPNALNATPLIRRERLGASVLAIASDGKLHMLNVLDGEDRMPPQQFVPPFSKNWSLNLDKENVLYTSVSQGCNGAKSGVYAMDLSTKDHRDQLLRVGEGRRGCMGSRGCTGQRRRNGVCANGRRILRRRQESVSGHGAAAFGKRSQAGGLLHALQSLLPHTQGSRHGGELGHCISVERTRDPGYGRKGRRDPSSGCEACRRAGP